MKKLTILFTFLLLSSCATKKVTTNKTSVEQTTDTVMIEKIIEVIKPVKETVYIDNPCDSIGNLNQFESVINSQHGRVTVKSENGKIKAEVNLDSIVSIIEKEYNRKISVSSETSENVIVKEKKPLWVYLLIVYSVMITALYIKKLFS